MRSSTSTLFLALATLAPLAQATTYRLAQNFVGPSFLTNFVHETMSDPTHGRVNYLSQAAALAGNLTYASGNTLIMRADYTNVLSANGPGRSSVRIRSIAAWQHGVFVWDIRHMPQGCGTWPAAWTTIETGWPAGGEIDVIEGVNSYGSNAMTLHTSPGCTMPSQAQTSGQMIGSVQTTDCNTADNGNAGCGVSATTPNSFGPSFNANGGGIYAMERTSSFIKIWFFPRKGGPSTPAALQSASASLDTSTWGTPQALFPNTNCNIDSHMSAHNIIFDLTFCGDWAGAVYGSDGCPSDCTSYVNQNPSAFANAYWDVAGVRVYQ